MNMKKLLCMVLALLMAVATVALAETDDLQVQLDAANARIQELEAEVEKYKPVYDSQIVAEFGEDGIIWLKDAQAEYEQAASAYAQYGLNIDDYAADIKNDILQTLVSEAVKDAKIAELGLDQISDEDRERITAEAEETYELYVDQYKSYFAAEDATEEDARAQTIAALEQYGMTQDVMVEQMLANFADEQLFNEVTKDVTVSDEEVEAKYNELIATDEESYANDRSFTSAYTDEEAVIAWYPEGYRAVKHVLIKFNDEQSAQYTELQNKLKSLNEEMEALDKPAEETEEAADTEETAEVAETGETAEVADTEETAEAADTEETAEAEPTAEPRTREEIQKDITEVAAQTEALYSELLPKAQQVIDEFNAGADFDSLIEKYNEDTGMTREPAATIGYAVAEGSTTWDPAFTEGAMSIAEIGQISEPVYGTNGIHVSYYLDDIPAGAVALADIVEAVRDEALSDKIDQTYADQVDAWVEAANPRYYADRF